MEFHNEKVENIDVVTWKFWISKQIWSSEKYDRVVLERLTENLDRNCWNLGRDIFDLWKVSQLNKTKYLAPVQSEDIAVFGDYFSKHSSFLGQVYERKQ